MHNLYQNVVAAKSLWLQLYKQISTVKAHCILYLMYKVVTLGMCAVTVGVCIESTLFEIYHSRRSYVRVKTLSTAFAVLETATYILVTISNEGFMQ